VNIQNMIVALDLIGYCEDDTIPGANYYQGTWRVTDEETFLNWFHSNTKEVFEGRPIEVE
jgi:hypothetical protein